MKNVVGTVVREALEKARKKGSLGNLAGQAMPEIIIERSKKDEFGDYSTNIAMLIAPSEKRAPRDIAEILSPLIAEHANVERCEVAGPGFINIFINKAYWAHALAEVLKKGADYGRSKVGAGKKVMLEFVSANPTGPLHIGHGRGAAVGDALARVMMFAGYDVKREFYINDRGRQILILGNSVRLRWLELRGENIDFPDDHYKGDYVREIAKEMNELYDPDVLKEASDGKGQGRALFSEFAASKMLENIKRDLLEFRIGFDKWYSETRELAERGIIEETIALLMTTGHTYLQKGEGAHADKDALFFKTTQFGDDKDRVLQKADGELTYFASDVAYHRKKYERKFDMLVNIWGADHHGYEARVRAGLRALGHDDAILKILFIQLVALLRKGEPVPMGKREGEFVTLKQVMEEVGPDACRFFFLMRKADAQLDFDLELAKSQAPENPVYYVQYCHARIKSIIAFAKESGVAATQTLDTAILGKLREKEEIDLIKHMSALEDTIAKAALAMEPHRLTFYLTELAGLFHPFYNKSRVVTDDADLTLARLSLCTAVARVVANGLGLLGVTAPAKM